MNTRTWAVTAFLLIGGLSLFGVVGCKQNSTDSDLPESSYVVTFVAEQAESFCWVVFNDPVSGDVLQVKTLGSNETYDFGASVPNHSTMTIAKSYDFPGGSFRTYQRAPAGRWKFGAEQIMPVALGRDSISVSFPSGQWSRFQLQTPSSVAYADSGFLNHNTDMHGAGNVFRLAEDNTYFMWALLEGATDLCGSLYRQGFLVNQTNVYNLTVDQPVPLRTVTTTRPLDYLSLAFSYNHKQPHVVFTSGTPDPDNRTFRMKAPPFQAEGIWLTGARSLENRYYGCKHKYQSVPSEFFIPSGTMTADYNEEAHALQNIQVNGQADWIATHWENGEMDQWAWWMVWAPPTSHTLAIPSMPDSILTAIAGTDAEFRLHTSYMEDYEPASGYDDCVFRMNALESDGEWYEFSDWYSEYTVYLTTDLHDGHARPWLSRFAQASSN